MLAASTASFGQGAQEAVQDVLNGIGDGNAAVLWDALPATYQNDISSLLHTFATKIDPTVWDKSFELCRKVVEVLKTKKEMILATPEMAQDPSDEKFEAAYDPIVDMLSLLVNSEISKLENVKKLDIGRFATGTGSKLIKKGIALGEQFGQDLGPLTAMREAKVTLVESSKGVEILSIEIPGWRAGATQFVQVEGKWVPQRLATTWAGMMLHVKAKLQAMIEPDPGHTEPIVPVFDEMIDLLDLLARAEDQDEFNREFDRAHLVVLAMGLHFGRQLQQMMFVQHKQTPEQSD